MKRIIVNPYQRALVFKNGAYKRMLKEGKYWLWPGEKADKFDMTYAFLAWNRIEYSFARPGVGS